MNCLLLALPALLAVCTPAATQAANPSPGLEVKLDRGARQLRVLTQLPADLVLIVGHRAIPSIPIGAIELDVLPEFVLPLGRRAGGEVIELAVPDGLDGLGAEFIALTAETRELIDSEVVWFGADDLVSTTFRAQLFVSKSIPPVYSVEATLTAPTEGYDLALDGIDHQPATTNVYLTLIEPGTGEIVIPVLTNHRQFAALGTPTGEVVDVYLRRTQRGSVGHDVYRRMARLVVSQ